MIEWLNRYAWLLLAAIMLLVVLDTGCGEPVRLSKVPGMDAAIAMDAHFSDAGFDAALDAAIDVLDASPSPDVGWTPPPDDRGPYDLKVVLHWDYGMPGRSTDVDLHLLHPDGRQWGLAPLDCFYGNENPVWDGTSSTSPHLDHDITTGYGPETITLLKGIDRPNPYRIGVHYYSDHGQGPSTAYVTIECRDLTINMGPQVLEDNQIWRLVDIAFWQDTCVIVPVDVITAPGVTTR